MKKQKVITVDWQHGAYYNFFFTPGSIESLNSIIENGWSLVFIKDDKKAERAVAVFEKTEGGGETAPLQSKNKYP